MFDSWSGPLDPSPDLDIRVPSAERAARIEAADKAIGETAGHVNAAYARLLADVAEIDALGAWSDQGAKSCEDWLAWRCGLPLHEARHHVRVARRLKELPKINGAFSRGELSYFQVRAIAPIATPEIEDSLLEMAQKTTATQLARIARAYKSCLDRVELERSNDRHAARGLNHFYDDDGFLIIRGRLTPEDGAVLVAALADAEKTLRDELSREETERTPATAFRADALVEVARRAQVAPADGKDPRTDVVVHVDVPSLIDGSGERCEIEDGPALASETVRRLCCDGTVQAVFEANGKTLDYGRRRRTIPPRLRKALEQRDETCRFPGCDRKRFRQGHHIVHWTHGGQTKPEEVVLLCFHHHRLVHEGGYRIEGNPEGMLTFIRPDGTEVPDRNGIGNGRPADLIRSNEKLNIKIDARTCTTLWDGYPPDYDSCVHALLTQGGILELPARAP